MAVRLRNLLVHRYCVIAIYEAVKSGLRDFEEYVGIVEGVVRVKLEQELTRLSPARSSA